MVVVVKVEVVVVVVAATAAAAAATAALLIFLSVQFICYSPLLYPSHVYKFKPTYTTHLTYTKDFVADGAYRIHGREDTWERGYMGERIHGREDIWERRYMGERIHGREDTW